MILVLFIMNVAVFSSSPLKLWVIEQCKEGKPGFATDNQSLVVYKML